MSTESRVNEALIVLPCALVIRCDGFDRLTNDYPSVRLEILSALTQRIRNQAPDDSD